MAASTAVPAVSVDPSVESALPRLSKLARAACAAPRSGYTCASIRQAGQPRGHKALESSGASGREGAAAWPAPRRVVSAVSAQARLGKHYPSQPCSGAREAARRVRSAYPAETRQARFGTSALRFLANTEARGTSLIRLQIRDLRGRLPKRFHRAELRASGGRKALPEVLQWLGVLTHRTGARPQSSPCLCASALAQGGAQAATFRKIPYLLRGPAPFDVSLG